MRFLYYTTSQVKFSVAQLRKLKPGLPVHYSGSQVLYRQILSGQDYRKIDQVSWRLYNSSYCTYQCLASPPSPPTRAGRVGTESGFVICTKQIPHLNVPIRHCCYPRTEMEPSPFTIRYSTWWKNKILVVANAPNLEAFFWANLPIYSLWSHTGGMGVTNDWRIAQNNKSWKLFNRWPKAIHKVLYNYTRTYSLV